MNFVKNRLRNRMNDGLLDECLVTFIERDIFLMWKKKMLSTLLCQFDGVDPIRTRSRF
jgi:hypothetical protein